MKTTLVNGWQMMKISDIALSVSTGGTPSRDKKEYWMGGDINWLKISDMKLTYISTTEEKITKLGLQNSSAKLLPRGTIVYSIFATLGAIGILNIESATNQAIAGIIPKKEIINTKYLYYCLQSERAKIVSKKSHATQDNLNLSILRNHEIPVPPLHIQQKIVSILEKVKKLKELRMEADKLTNDYLNAVFSDMFEGNHSFPNKKLGELCSKISSGSTPLGGNENYLVNGEILFIRSQNILMNQFSEHDSLYIPRQIHEKMKRTFVKKHDVLLNITGASIGRTAVYLGEDDKANVNQHVCIIRIQNFEEIDPTYLNYYLSSNNVQRRIGTINAGGTREALNFSQIKNFDIPIPPISDQKRFALIAKEIKNMKEFQKQSRIQIHNLFNNMTQKAFKGELVC